MFTTKCLLLAFTALLVAGCENIGPGPDVSADDSDGGVGSTEEALIVTAPQSIHLPMSADTVRSYLANTPGHTSRDLYVGRSLFDWTRSMVRVDTPAMRSALGAQGTLLSAKLQFTVTVAIDAALNNTQVGVHRMKQAWTEPGATWNCANDSKPTNWWQDCTTANRWVMGGAAGTGPFETAPSATSQVAGQLKYAGRRRYPDHRHVPNGELSVHHARLQGQRRGDRAGEHQLALYARFRAAL